MSFRWILITYVIMAIVGLVINTFVFLPKTSFSLEKLNVTSHSNVELGMDNPGVSVDNVNERKNSERSGDPAPVVNGSSEQVENDKYLNGMKYEFNLRVPIFGRSEFERHDNFVAFCLVLTSYGIEKRKLTTFPLPQCFA